MERRREPRVALNQPVWVTVLGANEARFAGTAVDLSGSGMRVTAVCQVAPNTPVKIETGESLYLAEVCYCIPNKGAFMIGVAVDQVLNGLTDLAQLRRRLANDSAPSTTLTEADAVHSFVR